MITTGFTHTGGICGTIPTKLCILRIRPRTLEDAPLIIAGSDKYAKIDAIVRDNYYAYEYMRLWWPMQDYWDLTFDRVKSSAC